MDPDADAERDPATTADASATVTTDGAGAAPPARRPAAASPRYRRGDEIARGRVGVVVAGVDERLGRAIAIKELLAPAPVTRARFQREAQITARLEHPGVVPIYDQGWNSDGEPFYVMRRVAGRSLSDELAARPTLGERLALVPVILAVADTVAYAHGEHTCSPARRPTPAAAPRPWPP